MSLKDVFNWGAKPSPASAKRKQREIDREAVKKEMMNSRVEAKTQQSVAERNIHAARAKAIQAQQHGDVNGKRIACNEIKVNLAVYRYMQSVQSAIDMMESNLRITEITKDLSRIVDRVGRLSVPHETVNFGALTKKAMKGLAVPDIAGLDGMVQSLLDGAAEATGLSDSDSWIEEFIANPTMTVDHIQAPVFSGTQTQTTVAQTAEAQPAQTSQDDLEMEDLIGLLEAMNGKK